MNLSVEKSLLGSFIDDNKVTAYYVVRLINDFDQTLCHLSVRDLLGDGVASAQVTVSSKCKSIVPLHSGSFTLPADGQLLNTKKSRLRALDCCNISLTLEMELEEGCIKPIQNKVLVDAKLLRGKVCSRRCGKVNCKKCFTKLCQVTAKSDPVPVDTCTRDIVARNIKAESVTTDDLKAKTVEVSGDLDVEGKGTLGSLKVKEDAQVCGDLEVLGEVSVQGDIQGEGDLAVRGDACLKGSVTLEGELNVQGEVKVCDDVNICGQLDVCGELNACDDAFVKKDLDVSGFISSNKDITANGTVWGKTRVKGGTLAGNVCVLTVNAEDQQLKDNNLYFVFESGSWGSTFNILLPEHPVTGQLLLLVNKSSNAGQLGDQVANLSALPQNNKGVTLAYTGLEWLAVGTTFLI